MEKQITMSTQPTVNQSSQLQVKVKACDPDVQAYVKHLESENKKLQTKCVKLESQKFTDKNRIAALEKELKKGHVRVSIQRFSGQKP